MRLSLKATPYLTLRDELGTLFCDEQFSKLFSRRGKPALSPWRLALVTIMQFRENLSDRLAADAVRSRIDWKYLLGLDRADPGFNFSVLCEFRARLIAGNAEFQLLDTLLERCANSGLLNRQEIQRTDSTHVLASIRTLSRLELIGEALRAALNEIAATEPAWLRDVTPVRWHGCYDRRIENSRLPHTSKGRDNYVQATGEDGVMLLSLVDSPTAPVRLQSLPYVTALRVTWSRNLQFDKAGAVRLRPAQEAALRDEQIESPYDPEARLRSKSGMSWTGYMAHFSETCDDKNVHLITNVHTTTADVHEAMCTDAIHKSMANHGLQPRQHFVDSAYMSADLLVHSADHGVELIGPQRIDSRWQSRVEGAYTADQFTVDWINRVVTCPQGARSTGWGDHVHPDGKPYHKVSFPIAACRECQARALCTRSKQGARRLLLHQQKQQEALQAARRRLTTDAGWALYARRAGIEGTLSQAVRVGGLRRARYRGLDKTHLQHVAIAAALNIDRIAAWLTGRPHASIRTSRFAGLAH